MFKDLLQKIIQAWLFESGFLLLTGLTACPADAGAMPCRPV